MSVALKTISALARPKENPAHASLKPIDRLGPKLFAVYKEAVRGGVYDPLTQRYIVPRHAWPVVHGALMAAGFAVRVDATTEAWLGHAKSDAENKSSLVVSRIALLEERLCAEGKTLRQYQLEAIRWLATQRAAFLFDEMGLGKTIQAICAIPENVPVIVDCPASLRLLWRDEIRKWRSDLTPCVVTNRSGFPSINEVWIVSDGWITKTIQTQPWEYPLPSNLFLISDEAHRYKGRSARTEAMQFFCADIRTLQGCTIALTGTPLMNRAMELYTLFLVFGAMRKAFGGWGEYKKLWNAKKGRFGETIWKEPKPELADRIRAVSLRRTRAQVLPELPAKTYQRIPSEAGARLSKRLDDLQDDIAEELEEYARAEGVEPPTKLVQDTKLRVELAKAKQEDMLAWIERNSTEEDDSPLVVFSMHRGPVEECGKLKGWRIITGDVSVKNRHDIVSEFQGGKLRGVALTLQSGGTGLTLTAAHRMLFVDRAYTPPDNWQAEDRVCRMGQTQPVIISRLVTEHPLEIRLDEILEVKSAMIRAAMGE